MKKTILIFLFLNISIITGQNLKGKWALIITKDMSTNMECLVLDISENQMKTYDFDSLMFSNSIKIDTIHRIVKQGQGKNISEFKYSIKDSITLTQHVRYQLNKPGNWKTKYWNYIKLLPTEVNFPNDTVLQKQYDLIYPRNFLKPNMRISFKETLCGEQAIEMIIALFID